MRTPEGKLISFDYNAKDRLIHANWPDAATTGFDFDAGRREPGAADRYRSQLTRGARKTQEALRAKADREGRSSRLAARAAPL